MDMSLETLLDSDYINPGRASSHPYPSCLINPDPTGAVLVFRNCFEIHPDGLFAILSTWNRIDLHYGVILFSFEARALAVLQPDSWDYPLNLPHDAAELTHVSLWAGYDFELDLIEKLAAHYVLP